MNITKGQSLNISKAATEKSGSELKNLTAAAGWDTETDLDLLTVYLGEDGKAIPDENANGTNADEAVCFFQNTETKGAKHSGDNRTGAGDGDDESIKLTLGDVPANVKEIVVAIASYGKDGNDGLPFGTVKGAFVRLYNTDDNTELVKYDLTDKYAEAKAVEMGRLTRTSEGWEFKATGVAVSGNFVEVLKSYGVTGVN
jgi:tellurium resistance protein TerD